jgi:hypothetical protein
MKYRKKPVIVEATQWFKMGDHPDVKMVSGDPCIYVTLSDQWIDVEPGDWIITDSHGFPELCGEDAFHETYQQVCSNCEVLRLLCTCGKCENCCGEDDDDHPEEAPE